MPLEKEPLETLSNNNNFVYQHVYFFQLVIQLGKEPLKFSKKKMTLDKKF